jgi:hypothetical protein
MTLDEARENIGRQVTYQPYESAPIEEGVITRVNNLYVFVHFRGDMAPKAIAPQALMFSHSLTELRGD